jgi:hypothetical protein
MNGVRDMSTLKGAVNLLELSRCDARANGTEFVLQTAEGDRQLELRIVDKRVCKQWIEALQEFLPGAIPSPPVPAAEGAGGVRTNLDC